MSGFKKDYYNYSITMEEFLNNFVFANGLGRAVDVTTGEVLELKVMGDVNHYDIDRLAFEGVVRANWEDVNEDSIRRGQIILVRANSWKGNGSMLLPYYRPALVLGDGYAAQMQKDFQPQEYSQPLPTSYDIRGWKKSRKRRR